MGWTGLGKRPERWLVRWRKEIEEERTKKQGEIERGKMIELERKGVERRRKVSQHVFKSEFEIIPKFVNIRILVLILK
jgi:hypothetical protein